MIQSAPASPSRFGEFLRSIRFRLTLWFVAILALILGAFSLFIYFRQIQVLRAETSSNLIARANQLRNYYNAVFHPLFEAESDHSNSGTLSLEALPLLQDNDMLALLDPNGQAIQKSSNFPASRLSDIYGDWLDSQNPASPIALSLTSQDSADGVKTGDYLFVVNFLDFEREMRAILVLGSPLDPGGQLPRLAFTLSLVFVLTLLVAFGGGYWLASQAMHPVQTITRAAQEIGEHDLNRRLHLGRADELGQLANTFDEMLNRLQAAFERQRQFTADASHELRTPLAIIELEAGRVLERRRAPEEYESALEIIQSENQWMSRLVNELLALARMDSGQSAMQNEKLDLVEIAVDVVERLTALARKNGVALLTGELGEGVVWADRTFLTYLLTNLVENGLKYARGENARVVVETGSQLRAEQAWMWVRVSDNGPGIPEEHLPHLFDRFYRIDAARSQSREENEAATSGSGLGLAIVQSIAQAFGGEVEVRSQVGSGTVFTVWLPAVER